ncbi:hypothetical protein [Elizabethkingia bruuniana]|uniref:hypothetical protein n=1 Tax=Elizabethkingia bruuniana TaxID=1756149 RepID=UPI00099A02E7|nr:hypothetical protein [Elizabethkingia bruuniana]OPC53451.1 hypothetical protein BAY07_15485 [Elizabethkingia bruuniana]
MNYFGQTFNEKASIEIKAQWYVDNYGTNPKFKESVSTGLEDISKRIELVNENKIWLSNELIQSLNEAKRIHEIILTII